MAYVKIGKAAKILGVTPHTLRKWEKEGQLVPERRSSGGTRFYNEDQLIPHKVVSKPTLAYARVSSYDQKEDLKRQIEMLTQYCVANGWDYRVIDDLGSGLNYKKKGLKEVISLIINEEVSRIVVTHKDRLLRFGSELVFMICENKGIDVEIINKGEELSFEEELAQDVLEIITVFSAKLYGSRSKKHKEVMETMRNVVST